MKLPETTLIKNIDDLFCSFAGRSLALRTVTRYSIFKVMYYRSNLLTHSKRVLWIIQQILPLIETTFTSSVDTTKLQLLALVHDDPEIITGDFQAGNKAKMSNQELAKIVAIEKRAIEELAVRFPFSLLGYPYKNLLTESAEVSSQESKILKYADRFDAFGEALHEIFAGNRTFITPVTNEYGTIDLPTQFYPRYFNEFKIKNPEFHALFSKNHHHPFFNPIEPDNLETLVSSGHPHSPTSIIRATFYQPYNFWKETILQSEDHEEIENLYTQKEA